MPEASRLRFYVAVLLKAGFALVGGGVAYSLWLGLFLLTVNDRSEPAGIFLWLLAPVITAAGFAGAAALYDYILHRDRARFRSVYGWAFAACALGGLLVYWIGPMLIVFSMLASGTIAIAGHEVIHTREGEDDDPAQTR